MNKFKKYCPNVWIAECDEEYGKAVECKAYNHLGTKTVGEDKKHYYSIVRTDDTSYAERKAEKYANAAERSEKKSRQKLEAANEGSEFLSLGEPIKAGHHSEKRHRALLERNWKRCEQAVEASNKANEQRSKAEYWERKAQEITLANPESLEYFKEKLKEAEEHHRDLKEHKEKRTHSYSLTYAKKAVNELKKKVATAEILWG